jgi:hypothetical protein
VHSAARADDSNFADTGEAEVTVDRGQMCLSTSFNLGTLWAA